jgi:hypothetical protein
MIPAILSNRAVARPCAVIPLVLSGAEGTQSRPPRMGVRAFCVPNDPAGREPAVSPARHSEAAAADEESLLEVVVAFAPHRMVQGKVPHRMVRGGAEPRATRKVKDPSPGHPLVI